MIVGIDEVGRGAWAGPVCVGAVLLPHGSSLHGLADSKVLTVAKREILSLEIKKKAISIGIGWASAKYIDSHGIVFALKKATKDAMDQVDGVYDEIIVDGTINLLEGERVTLLKKADSLIPAVSAASIIAKVARDKYMTQLDERFSSYGFARHVGYGTAIHLAALEEVGPSVIHRMSFSPMAVKTSTSYTPRITSGSAAEMKAAEILMADGYTIIEKNWKTRWCEIDIIAKRAGIIYFFEVKYRKTSTAGTGFDYITPAKLHRMRFAAELWLLKAPTDQSAQLAAIELYGPGFMVGEIDTNISQQLKSSR